MTNGRLTVLCLGIYIATGIVPTVCAQPQPLQTNPVFRISATRKHDVTVMSSRREYEIALGGTVDMDNTMTRRYDGFDVAFQPNISLEIVNTGNVPVVNPRVVSNGKRQWWSLDELLHEILQEADDDQEKALFIWDFVRKHRHHDAPLFQHDELHDPVKFLCIYGGGLCDDSANVGCSLLHHAGMSPTTRPKTRSLHGHVMCEAWLAGDYQFLDIDEDAFYLDRENERLVSGDVLARDHDLVKREHAYGPIFQGWDIGERAAALFGRDDGAGFRAVAGHRIEMTLRPGEAIVYRWDDRGKFASEGETRRQFWGNSLLRYSPRLDSGRYQEGVLSAKDIVKAPPNANGAKLAGASKDAFLIYEITSPFVICGGRVQAFFVGTHPQDEFSVEASLDGESWSRIWSKSQQGSIRCDVALDESLQVNREPPKYRYLIRLLPVSAKPGSALLSELTIETDVMTSPHFLPRLSLGRNQIVYSDETPGPHEVQIAYHFRESDNIIPPPPPKRPEYPARGAVVRQSTFKFRWPPVKEAERYHIQVSRHSDMKLPYRTAFDLVVDHPEHGSPFTGMFSPDTDYFWRVRSRNKQGVWGAWSDVWRFRWDGPRVPVDLACHVEKSGEIVISWKPNPRGATPVTYDVYGSDERGFSVSKQTYMVRGLGKQPSNFLVRTTARELRVVVDQPKEPNQNRCYYRVVAVDRNGTSSGPSDYVELPHPYIYSNPNATASVGKPYRYQLRTLRSIGDLQHRYTPPNQHFWEREEYEFELIEAPGWLRLDRKSGLLDGTPGAQDIGLSQVVVAAKRQYPHEVRKTDQRGTFFQKAGAPHQANHMQRFKIQVQ